MFSISNSLSSRQWENWRYFHFWELFLCPTNTFICLLSTETILIVPFSRVEECQNSSKSHLFQKLKNTTISRWLYVSKMSPRMSNLRIDGSTKPQLLAKKWIFFRNFRCRIGLSIRREEMYKSYHSFDGIIEKSRGLIPNQISISPKCTNLLHNDIERQIPA